MREAGRAWTGGGSQAGVGEWVMEGGEGSEEKGGERSSWDSTSPQRHGANVKVLSELCRELQTHTEAYSWLKVKNSHMHKHSSLAFLQNSIACAHQHAHSDACEHTRSCAHSLSALKCPVALFPPEETHFASLFTFGDVHNLLSAETNWQDKTHSRTNGENGLHCALITRPAEMPFDLQTLFDQRWTGGNDTLSRCWPYDVHFSPQGAFERTW